jgi:hypothetical protein
MTLLKRIIAVLSLALFSVVPAAQAGIYFEYAPDPWQSLRLNVSAGDTPYQFFQSASDFTMTGFDLWVDNTGNSGNVTFTVLDDQNTTLGQETVTLSPTPSVPGGTKLHVDLSTALTISHYRTYSIQISSTLPGFGLYYANRINILEHNLQYTTEYALGVASLGSVKQNYTFKFALTDSTEDQAGSEPDPEDPEEEAPAATSSVATIISNARIVSVTQTTVTAAWTTNLAADSRATIRSQLNPLYLYTSTYDPTLELEHTLVITGLVPGSLYFIDFFSQQNPSEPILTTYTVSFATAAGTTAPPTPPATPSPAPTPTPTPPPTTPTPTPTSSAPGTTSDEEDEEETAPTDTSNTAQLPPALFSAGSGSESFSINWNAPEGGEPNGGYRIDIFDENHQLIRQLRAPSGTYNRNVAILPPGTHEVIVYADRDGVYEKVAAPTSFEAEKTRSPLFWFWYLIGVVLAVGIGFAFLFSRHEKTELTPLE